MEAFKSFFILILLSKLTIFCLDQKGLKNNKNNDNELFQSLRNLITLIDQLRDCGVNEYIELPRICTLGTQSSGKSSVLESIVGLDFLPRGNGIVTRRPLELRLFNNKKNESWAQFEERKNIIYKNFTEVKKTIEELTTEVCGNNKSIIDKPIILSVHCKTCPDLTLVDLPGITRVPVGEQPENIEEITRNMAKRYIDNNLTIILCVIAANSDIATSDGLKLAKEIDVEGTRTLGVLTKLDIMDEGTDAKNTMQNKEILLKLGYIGVINRSKKDLDNNLSMEEISKKEKDFFKSHSAYKNMDPKFFGTENLINKLTTIYFEKITENIPKIINSINTNIKNIEAELKELGEPVPQDKSGKINMLLQMINEYCQIFRNVLQGKALKNNNHFLKNEGGFKIRKIYENLLKEYIDGYKAGEQYSDEDVEYVVNKHEGHSIPGFPDIDSFLELLEPLFQKLKNPIDDSFQNITQYLEFLSKKIIAKVFQKFPNEIIIINQIIENFFAKIGNKTEYLIENIFSMETSYLFTNDGDYLRYNTNNNLGKTKTMKDRINAYFQLVVRNLRESIPKIIGKYLVKEIEDNMQNELYKLVYNLNNTENILIENESIIERRKKLNHMIDIMKNAQKIIGNNPYFINSKKLE